MTRGDSESTKQGELKLNVNRKGRKENNAPVVLEENFNR